MISRGDRHLLRRARRRLHQTADGAAPRKLRATFMNIHARIPSRVFWRQQILHRRAALFVQWRQLFPRHDFGTLRLIQSAAPPIVPWPNEAAWAESARRYHEERRRRACA
jgi:hypothetical protein